MFDRFCFLMRWLHQGSDCQMKKLLVLPCFPDLDQRFAGNLKEVGQMEPDTAPHARKKEVFRTFFGGNLFILKTPVYKASSSLNSRIRITIYKSLPAAFMKNRFFSRKKAIFGTTQKPLRQKSS